MGDEKKFISREDRFLSGRLSPSAPGRVRGIDSRTLKVRQLEQAIRDGNIEKIRQLTGRK